MWLLPAFSRLSRFAMRTYFRLQVEGYAIPAKGPMLLVANHPNSLLDPALVAAAARRPVRFLAKATLLSVPVIGWLVRGAGAIPVHRRQDDPLLMGQNVDAFEAAHEALEHGAAIGIFPEGVSHDEPSIAPLRTGAARIALETALRIGRAIPVVPIGLVFREKGTFRSEALIIVGDPIAWDDLASTGATAESVRDLTARIDFALRRVTLNLESWEDGPLVSTAYAVFAAEFELRDSGPTQLARLRTGTKKLAEMRRSGDERWRTLVRDIMRHHRFLAGLRLSPADLRGTATLGDAAWRAGRVLPFLAALALTGGAIGTVLFWPPYRLIALTERILKPLPYVRSTTKVLSGIVLFGLWIASIATTVGYFAGLRWGLVAAALLPLAALATIAFHERLRAGRHEARRFLLKRTRGERLAELRAEQRRIAEAIAELVEREPFLEPRV